MWKIDNNIISNRGNTLAYLFSLEENIGTDEVSLKESMKDVVLKRYDYAEFGTVRGNSTKIIHELKPKKSDLYTFDSFQGLPEDWKVGKYVRNIKGDFKFDKPKWLDKEEDIILYEGLFKDTLPEFLKKKKEPLAFINIDCDIYKSTYEVLDNLNDLIIPGTIIHFDDFYNYGGDLWLMHEYLALMHFVIKYNRYFIYLGRTNNSQVWIKIII